MGEWNIWRFENVIDILEVLAVCRNRFAMGNSEMFREVREHSGKFDTRNPPSMAHCRNRLAVGNSIIDVSIRSENLPQN